MSAVPQNPLNPPVFEIPDPPPEFGQDGGKFYRHYDALAQEIDDDMTGGLKEQLDGMLIFVSRLLLLTSSSSVQLALCVTGWSFRRCQYRLLSSYHSPPIR